MGPWEASPNVSGAALQMFPSSTVENLQSAVNLSCRLGEGARLILYLIQTSMCLCRGVA